jgi:hypothetical protein
MVSAGAPTPAHTETVVLGALSALGEAIDGATSEHEVLARALPILRTVLGDHVAVDLRPTASVEGPGTSGGAVAPVLGGGTRFGVLRASGCGLDVATAQAFASAAAWLLGTGLAVQQERTAPPPDHVAPALEHRLRSALATIGVASSTLRARGDDLDPDLRTRLLEDIEANVSTLRSAIDDLTSHDPGHRADG